MYIYKALDIDLGKQELICFVGAGGKTTAMFCLAKELKGRGKRVLVTTTTAILSPDEDTCDAVIIDASKNSDVFSGQQKSMIIVAGRERSSENKLLGMDRQFISILFGRGLFDYVLVEADGARHKSVKAPAAYEPVIPCATTKIAGVIGLDVLGKPISSEYVHRPEIFSKVVGSTIGARIDESTIFRIIVSEEGLFKAAPQNCQKYLLLNKAENDDKKKAAKNIIELLKKADIICSGFIVASMHNSRFERL